MGKWVTVCVRRAECVWRVCVFLREDLYIVCMPLRIMSAIYTSVCVSTCATFLWKCGSMSSFNAAARRPNSLVYFFYGPVVIIFSPFLCLPLLSSLLFNPAFYLQREAALCSNSRESICL